LSAIGTALTLQGLGMGGNGTLQAQTNGSPTPNSGGSGNKFALLSQSGYLAYPVLTTAKTYALVLVPNGGSGTPQTPIPLPSLQGTIDQSNYFLTMYADPIKDILYITIGNASTLWVYKYSVNVISNTVSLINCIQPYNNTNLGGASQAFQDVPITDNLAMGIGISQLGVNGSYNTSYILGYLYNPNLGTTDPMELITPQNNIVAYDNIVTSLATVNNVLMVNGNVYVVWGNLEHSYALYQLSVENQNIIATQLFKFNITNKSIYGDFQYQPFALDVTTDGIQYIWIAKVTSNSNGNAILDVTKIDVISKQVIWENSNLTFSSPKIAFLNAEYFNQQLWIMYEDMSTSAGNVYYVKLDPGNGNLIGGSPTLVSSNDGKASWSPKMGVVGSSLYCTYVYTTQSNSYTGTQVYLVFLGQSSAKALGARVVNHSYASAYLSTPLRFSGKATEQSFSSAQLSKLISGMSAHSTVRSRAMANLTFNISHADVQKVIPLHGVFVYVIPLKGMV
jgi:hypothetical protein